MLFCFVNTLADGMENLPDFPTDKSLGGSKESIQNDAPQRNPPETDTPKAHPCTTMPELSAGPPCDKVLPVTPDSPEYRQPQMPTPVYHIEGYQLTEQLLTYGIETQDTQTQA